MKKFKRVLSVLLCLTLVFAVFQCACITSSAVTQADIDRLKKQKASDEEVLKAIRARITAVNAEIAKYNQKINNLNSKIAENKAEIAKSEAEIESDKQQYRKRLRSMYMSSNDSNVRILLGAQSFSQYLQLAELTASVSAHDKRLIDDLVAKIKGLNEKNQENERLVAEQVEAKKVVDAQQAELKKQENDAAAIYNKSSANLDAAIAQKKAEDDAIRRRASGGGGSANTPSFVNDSGSFLWPVGGFYYISAGFQSNDAVHRGSHNGIDIAGGGISGQPIRAISDGYVSYVNNSCSHNYKKSGSCGCGGGYGNYCIVNHGSVGGATYSAYYAHAASIIVSPGQKVSRGQTLGYVGTTGWSTGYHLHLGILRNGGWINPSSLSFQK